MIIYYIIVSCLIYNTAEESINGGFCDASTKVCEDSEQRLIYYDVNPPEGFNLRRDVYMRFAIMLSEARKAGQRKNWRIVLPPWYRMYHWKLDTPARKSMPWGAFFDIDSLKAYAPVVELHEVFSSCSNKVLEIDRLYVLLNYESTFKAGAFEEKWELAPECEYGGFWGYSNITAKEVVCVRFQGKISKLWELIALHPSDKSVMFSNGEIPLHNTFGTKPYWDCRKSMKFNKELVETAKKYMRQYLNCRVEMCISYIAIHWRRQDFVYNRRWQIPSIEGTVRQVDKAVKDYVPNVTRVFIATDASADEAEELATGLRDLEYKVFIYTPSESEMELYRDGGIAIIDQIICSHAAYFMGTHESTFSFRIQEEREIMGMDIRTTFNRLCPDTGKCDGPTQWTIVE